MSGPFRELFSELPAALFDMLKGIGEQAVKNAQPAPQPHHRPSVASQLGYAINDDGYIGRFLCERYGWQSVTMYREPASRQSTLAYKAACGHPMKVTFTDWILEDSANPGFALLDVLDDLHSKAARRCYCVPREARQ